MIHQRRFGEQLLCDESSLNHLFDLWLEVMALIDHEGNVGLSAGLECILVDFVEDAEYLIGVNGP